MDESELAGNLTKLQQTDSETVPAKFSDFFSELDWREGEILRLESEERLPEALLLAQETAGLVQQRLGESHPRYATGLNNLGAIYYSLGDYTHARDLYEEALRLMQQSPGDPHPNLPSALNNLGLLNKKLGDYTSAIQLSLQALEAYRASGNTNEPLFLILLHNLALLHDFLGSHSDALPLHQEVLELRRRLIGEDHLDYALSLDRLAATYYELSNYEASEPLYQRALEVRRANLGAAHPVVALSLNNLATLFYAKGNYRQAISFLKQAVEMERATLGETHARLGTSLLNLAEMHRTVANYEVAEPIYKEAMGILLATTGEQNPDYATATNNLGLLYQAAGRYQEAANLLRKALDLRRSIFGAEHVDVAMSLSNLAALNEELGNYRAAEPGYRQANEILRSRLGEKHPDVATSLSNLASLRWDMGDHETAEELLREALDIEKQVLGTDHPRYATTLHNLAALLRDTGRTAEAEQLYEQVLAIRGEALGTSHPGYASTLSNLAVLYQSLGKYEAAEERARQVLKIRSDVFGEDHPLVARALGILGSILLDAGDPMAAEPLLRRAISVYTRTLGDTHSDIAPVLNNIAVLCAKTARETEAIALMKQVADIDDLLIGQIFGISSERERMSYLGRVQANYFAFLSLLLSQLSVQPDCASLSLDLVLRRKAIAAEVLTIQRDEALSGKYPELASKLSELSLLRAEIARKMLSSTVEDGQQLDNELLRDLTRRKEQLEVELAAQIPEVSLHSMLGSAHRQAIAAALPAGSVLVEFVRADILDFDGMPTKGWRQHRRHPRYLALVLRSGHPDTIRMLDLGPALEIDTLIADFRNSIQSARQELRHGPAHGSDSDRQVALTNTLRAVRDHTIHRSTSDLTEIGRKLCTAVFEPLVSATDGATHLFVSPDGDLTLLPLEVLPLARDQYVIDRYQVSYAGAGRDVLRFLVPSAGRTNPPLVAVDPDFNLNTEAAGTEKAVDQEFSTRQARGLEHQRFSRLPATREEGQLIGEMLGVEPLTGAAVSKANIQMVQSPLVLHIATHGFFLDNQAGSTILNVVTDTQTKWTMMAGFENPLLRSGLALAGANAWLEGNPVPPGVENGILTAEEVSGMDLSNTELAVLSACDTGLGRVHTGEGVFGLRRAFVLAGVRTLVMSLWQVPDRLTQELMVDFYQRVLAGQGRAEALRDAQLRLKSKHNEPLYWGAFICLGHPGPLPSLLKPPAA